MDVQEQEQGKEVRHSETGHSEKVFESNDSYCSKFISVRRRSTAQQWGEVVGAHVLDTLQAVVFAGKCNGGASPVRTGMHWTFSGWARGLGRCQCNLLMKPAGMIPQSFGKEAMQQEGARIK